jgi:GNAT superfamily N-acetyltransferase
MIRIERVDIDQADRVFDLVGLLLAELSDDDDEFHGLDRDKILADWKRNAERFTAFIAHSDQGALIGVITLTETFAIYAGGCYGVIDELYVAPEFRSRQVGRMLLEQVKEHGRTRGWQRIDVTAPLGTKWRRTVDFYLREGFVHTGPKLRYKR